MTRGNSNAASRSALFGVARRAANLFRGGGRERTRDELKLGIAGFYDRSSKLWEDVWGEHMHHGEKSNTLPSFFVQAPHLKSVILITYRFLRARESH